MMVKGVVSLIVLFGSASFSSAPPPYEAEPVYAAPPSVSEVAYVMAYDASKCIAGWPEGYPEFAAGQLRMPASTQPFYRHEIDARDAQFIEVREGACRVSDTVPDAALVRRTIELAPFTERRTLVFQEVQREDRTLLYVAYSGPERDGW